MRGRMTIGSVRSLNSSPSRKLPSLGYNRWASLSCRQERLKLRHDMGNEALEQLETKLAFLDHANAVLGEVVTRQQRDIDALRARVEALAALVQSSQDSDGAPRTPADERPPHY